MLEWIAAYWVEVAFGLLCAVGGAGWTWLRGRLKRLKAIELGVQCLLRAELIRCYDKYMERGYCPLYAREALERAYGAYHGLGGNDVITDMMAKLRGLPQERRPEREE